MTEATVTDLAMFVAVKKHVWSVPIYDGESIRVLQEAGFIPWDHVTDAIADDLDSHPGDREAILAGLVTYIVECRSAILAHA